MHLNESLIIQNGHWLEVTGEQYEDRYPLFIYEKTEA